MRIGRTSSDEAHDRFTKGSIACSAAFALFAIVVTAPPARADDARRTVSVSGQCLRTALPDRGSINVVPEFQDKDIKVATKKATASYEAVKKAVQALKLKSLELQTSEYSVNEITDDIKGKSVSRGFRARMGLLVTTSDIARLGEVIAVAANNGVKDVGSLNTFLSDEKARAEREACFEEAIQHASAKASRMAGAAGAKLGKILTLQEDGASQPVPMRSLMLSEKMASEPAPQVDTSAQKIQLSVNAIYSLE